MRTPKQTDPQFKLRLTPELDAAIEKAAAQSGRTKNSEILYLIELALELADLVDQYRQAEERLFEQAKAERALVARIEELGRKNDELFDLTQGQHKTIMMQAETMEVQSQTIKTQSAALDHLAAEKFYEYALDQLSNVPDEERGWRKKILDDAMQKAAKRFGFDWPDE